MRKLVHKTSRTGGYVAFRKAAGRFIETLEYYSSKFFGDGSSPFNLTGALVLGFVIVNLVTGTIMLLHYSPTPESASSSIRCLTNDVVFGKLLRAIHRASADLLILTVLFHLVRVWATGRYIHPRSRNWVIGLLALPLIGIIGWAGYILAWDDRAMVLLAWGRELAYAADKWPIIGWFNPGSIIGYPLFGVSNEADQLLRIFGLHIGGAFLIIWMALWHLKRVTPPRAKLPVVVWIGLLLVILLVAAMMPLENEELRTFNPFAPPSSIYVDCIILFPLLFYTWFGGPILAVLIVLFWILLALLPKLEERRIPTAVVSEIACVGCRLCYDDCPYGAIEMIPHPDPDKGDKGYEIARIISSNCSSCGICVGSCEFDAVELPMLTSAEIIERIWLTTTPSPNALPNEVNEE